MFSQVSKILEKYVEPGDTVILGVSGGPDSMALLDIFRRYSEMFPIKIMVAHVNHGLRGKASDKDAEFVRDFISSLDDPNIGFRSKKIILKSSDIENQARTKRREFFQALKDYMNAKWICLAHHRDDNIESIVLHFLRGAGPMGLAGMEEAKNGYLRPFLQTSKKDILRYLKSRKLKSRIDRTNESNQYRRNFTRNRILPLFQKINPSYQKTLLRNGEIFRSLGSLLEEQAEEFLKNSKPESLFSVKDFVRLSRPLRDIVIQKSFQKATQGHYRLPYIRVDAVRKMIEKNVGKKRVGSTKSGFFVLEKGRVAYR